MEILGQSTKTIRHPLYTHLGYTAANNGTGSLMNASFGLFNAIAIIFFILLATLSKNKKVKGVTSIITLLLIGILFVGLAIQTDRYYPSYCIGSVARGLESFAHDNDGLLPDADEWCDQLVLIGAATFDYEGVDVLPGESPFALNIFVAGKKLSELPSDTVLIFETDSGIESMNRAISIRDKFQIDLEDEQSKRFFKSLKNACHTYPADIDTKIFPNRWNLAGGPEMATTKYNGGKGCDVAFVNGKTAFIKAKDIAKLRWTVEEIQDSKPVGQVQ